MALLNVRNMRLNRVGLRQNFIFMSLFTLIGTIVLWLVWQWAFAESRWNTPEKKETFEQSLKRANKNLFNIDTVSREPLDIYGLKKRLAKSVTWKKFEDAASAVEDSLHLVAAADFNMKPHPKFVLAESLSAHIHDTLEDHQRFLVSSFVQLQYAVDQLSDLGQRQLLKRKLVQLSTHSTEYNRILRKELADLRWRIGHSQRSQNVLRGLRTKILQSIEQRQTYPCARALRCVVDDPYGFASGIHWVLVCLIKGMLEDRRIIVDTGRWHYTNPTISWEKVLRSLVPRPEEHCSEYVPRIVDPPRDSILYEIPKDIAEPLVQHHARPYDWWLAQFVGYIMRPSRFTEMLVQRMKVELDFRTPIVGLHIRRTDKFKEGAYHRVEEYMAHVEEYYRSNFHRNVTKRVFVATDEPQAIDELREKFPDYVIISNTNSTRIAHSLNTRDGQGALETVLVDLFLLSQSNKLICTLSSGVCRIAYELMLANRDDVAEPIVSLDVGYYFAYKLSPPRKAIHPHEPSDESELHLSAGSCVVSPNNRFVDVEATKKADYDGFSTGAICHSNGTLVGKYPLYKTISTVASINRTIL